MPLGGPAGIGSSRPAGIGSGQPAVTAVASRGSTSGGTAAAAEPLMVILPV
jgi:hypothetical protein